METALAGKDEVPASAETRPSPTFRSIEDKKFSPVSPMANKESTPISATTPDSASRHGPSRHSKLVFSDPVAFRYLEEDPSTIVLDRRRRLEGYEIYVVEQWACSRVHPTFIIATYTGDVSHSILVGVLSVPTDESAWSTRLRTYFKAISQFHARQKETALGTIMVTNLSGFPSALTVVAVPDGDVKKHREDFIVNENLKRLGCSGRATLSIQAPTAATQAKFHQLYRTSERVPFYTSVMELVKLSQVALAIYDKLAPEYADGLLCDVTERAINDWWTDIGTDVYNVDPSDGILGATTVSALLGLLIGAHNRLKAFGAPVGKDAFDIASMKRAIGYFQKQQKLEKTRRLDRQTLDKLHRATAKAASGEGWAVPQAIKSTVAELSGKGGEMVMGMVGAREKVGIAEAETLDIDRLAQLVTGARAKWLWQGKPPKYGTGDVFQNLTSQKDMIFTKDDQGGYAWTNPRRDSVGDLPRARTNEIDPAPHPVSRTGTEDRDLQLRRNLTKPAQNKKADAKSGLGRLKDAVGIPGLRSHHHKHSKEGPYYGVDGDNAGFDERQESEEAFEEAGPTRERSLSPSDKRALMLKHAMEDKVNDRSREDEEDEARDEMPAASPLPDLDTSRRDMDTRARSKLRARQATAQNSRRQADLQEQQDMRPKLDTNGSEYGRLVSSLAEVEGPESPYLRRRESARTALEKPRGFARAPRNPRHLSFSAVEEVVLTWEDVSADQTEESILTQKPAEALRTQQALETGAKLKAQKIHYLKQTTIPWVESQVDEVDKFDQTAQAYQEELNALYLQRLEDYQMLRSTSTDVIREDKLGLTEGMKAVETMGAKLDYEINALQSRVEDVEDGVAEFERNIIDIEARVGNLIAEEGMRDSWFPWPAWCYRLGNRQVRVS